MPAPDINVVKDWCRASGDQFDTLLPMLIAAATRLASHETGVDFAVQPMPEPVQAWVCAQCAYWLDNPAAANERALLPSAFHAGLLDPHRSHSWMVLTT